MEFEVIEAEFRGDTADVGGRCLDQPIELGVVATHAYRFAWPQGLTLEEIAEDPDLRPTRIDVREFSPPVPLVEIKTYGRSVERLEPVYTGRLILKGDLRNVIREGDVLRFQRIA